MEFIYNDGGRANAGWKGSTGDCVTRAIAIATENSYQTVYTRLNEIAKKERPRNGHKRSSARNGTGRYTYDRYMAELGWTWVPTMKVGKGCVVHLNDKELPKGRLVVRVSRHMTAMVDGVIHDTYDCSRGGRRCVYGYWIDKR